VKYIYPLAKGLEIFTGVVLNYSDEYYSSLDLDVNKKHDDYTRVQARYFCY
jgi:hypothetical protein